MADQRQKSGILLTTLNDEYKATFTNAISDLRNRAHNSSVKDELNKIKNEILPDFEQCKTQILDTRPTEVSVEALIKFYLWLTICLVAHSIAANFMAPVLFPILWLADFSKIVWIFIACIVIPFTSYKYGRGNRINSFIGAVLSGLILGHVQSQCYFLNWIPPMSAMPMAISIILDACADTLAKERKVNRGFLIAICVGSPAAALMIIGFVFNSCDLTYISFTAVYAAMFAMSLQWQLSAHDNNTNDKKVVYDVSLMLGLSTLICTCLTMLTSVNKQEYYDDQ